MKTLQIIILSLLVSITSQVVFAQRQSSFIAPQITDSAITTNLNNHYVSINNAVSPKNQLFVFLPGTGAVAFNYTEINNTAADLGFHSINLTYPNDDAINSLCGGNSTDLTCYGNARLEVLDGINRSNLVNVNRANSIENRLIKLLIYLRNQRPTENWNQFLINDSTLDWSKIVISGHSQGGGHAGIIGRYHSVTRVVMFAAMDFNAVVNAPADWIALPNSTPDASTPDKFWGFGHQRDELVNFNTLSTRIWTAYGMTPFGSILSVDNLISPYGNSHSLTSNTDCTNYHGCIVADARLVFQNGIPIYKPVWEYLLSGTTSILNLNLIQFLKNDGTVVSRPQVGSVSKQFRISLVGSGFNSASRVLINGIETETEFVSPNEIRAKLPAGKLGRIGGSVVQVRDQNNLTSNLLSF